MTKLANSKRSILDLAEALMQDKGFNGFSYAHLSGALGVKNAAIHYHFPSKEDLGCAVVRRYRDRFQLWTGNARVRDLEPEEKLEWFFGIYTAIRADQGKVCLVGALEAEFNSIPRGLQKEVEALHGELLDWLGETLAEGREAGAFRFSGDPVGKAALILSSLQGGLQMARALGTGMFHELVDMIKEDLIP